MIIKNNKILIKTEINYQTNGQRANHKKYSISPQQFLGTSQYAHKIKCLFHQIELYKMPTVKTSAVPINIPCYSSIVSFQRYICCSLPIVPQGLTTDSAHSLLFRKLCLLLKMQLWKKENKISFRMSTKWVREQGPLQPIMTRLFKTLEVDIPWNMTEICYLTLGYGYRHWIKGPPLIVQR